MTESPLSRTIQSYDRTVADYLARWRDRSIMAGMADRFVSLLPISSGPRPLVADIGCGPGFDAAFFRERGLKVIGLDLSSGMLGTGRRDYPGDYIQADMRHLPLASLFDGLWVNASLLHLPRSDVPLTVEGFARALIPGGCLFLSIKEGHADGWQDRVFGRDEPRFFTYWHSAELDALLYQCGFTIISAETDRESETSSWLVRFARK